MSVLDFRFQNFGKEIYANLFEKPRFPHWNKAQTETCRMGP